MVTPRTWTWLLGVTLSEPRCKVGAWQPNNDTLCFVPTQSSSVLTVCFSVSAVSLFLTVSSVVQNVVIGEETGHKLQSEVIDMIDLAQLIKYCLLAVGLVLMLCGCLLLAGFIYRRRCARSVTTAACVVYSWQYRWIKLQTFIITL